MLTRDYKKSLEPLLIDFKRHIRVTATDMDATLKLNLSAAVRSAEHYVGMVIVQSRFVFEDSFRQTVILPVVPVMQVSKVTVDGTDLEESEWRLKDGRIIRIDDSVHGEMISVDFVAGSARIEPDIEAAILLHAAALFSNPVDSVEALPKASTRLLDPYRRWGIR